MIKKKKSGKIEVDLTGPEGNAFFLMGLANRLSKQMGIESEPIINDMMSGDYEHLIDVFDKHFGKVVILYR